MTRIAVVSLALSCVLVLPSAAAAKGLVAAEACGADGCTSIPPREFTGSLYATGDPARRAVPPAEHVRFVVHHGAPHGRTDGFSSFLWVPSHRRFGTEGRPGGPPNWFTVDRRQAADLNRWSQGVAPLPAGRYVVSAPDPFVGDRTPPVPEAAVHADGPPALVAVGLAALALLAAATVVLRRRRVVPRP